MINFNRLKKNFHLSKRQKGQVFILATLIIVVYSVSIIAVVTELSIERTKTDDINLPHMVDEYLSEMNYQLQLQLFNYIGTPAYSSNDIILGIQAFIGNFTTYAFTKGIGTTINLRLNEFSFFANKNATVNPITLSPDYTSTTYISINSSIVFQSSNSGSKVSGTFNHYYGINMFVSQASNTILQLTQRDISGNVLKFITGASFFSPSPMADQNDGSYISGASLNNAQINVTLSTGLQIVS